jgi:glycosyltransferase involved in cell wall biosynthesis
LIRGYKEDLDIMTKLCVFPNDPLESYFRKGEIKPRYFNPKNLFSEIHVISLFDSDANENDVKEVAGDAILKIHVVGKTNLLNLNSKKQEVLQLIREINPDVIRSYNPQIQGWVATQIGKELKIPIVISLHGDYDRDLRYHARKNRNFKSFFKLIYSKNKLEKYSLKNADKVIIIYDFIKEYAKKLGAKDITLIHNRIDLSQFTPKSNYDFNKSKPMIICVGRLMSEKNQQCLIKAVKDLEVSLVIVGDGVQYNELVSLVEELGIKDKVKFKKSVPNSEIHKLYASSDLFALPIKYGGFSIPELEAAASGLPVIIPKNAFGENPEIVRDFAYFVDNNPESFKDAIQKILNDEKLYHTLSKKGVESVKKINSNFTEEKEKQIYLDLFS